MPELNWSIIVLGCVGGMLPDVLRTINNRFDKKIPSYLKRPLFWIGFFLLVAIGGFAAWLFGATTAKDAVIYGFAAPELISRLISEAKAPPTPQKGTTEFNLRNWWAR